MIKYIIKRIIGMIPTLLIIITLSFFIVRVAPGGPFATERAMPEVIKRNIEAKYHLDEPLIKQYGRYLFDVMRGDLGPSYKYKDYDVNYYIFNSLPNSMVLGTISMAIALVVGILLGVLAAIYQNSWVDYLCMAFAVMGNPYHVRHRANPADDFRLEPQMVPHQWMVHHRPRVEISGASRHGPFL
jgi:oligopeptide transport system permease protein